MYPRSPDQVKRAIFNRACVGRRYVDWAPVVVPEIVKTNRLKVIIIGNQALDSINYFQFGKRDKIPRRWFVFFGWRGKQKTSNQSAKGFQLKTEQQSPKSVCLCDTPTQNPFVITASSVRLEKRKKK